MRPAGESLANKNEIEEPPHASLVDGSSREVVCEDVEQPVLEGETRVQEVDVHETACEPMDVTVEAGEPETQDLHNKETLSTCSVDERAAKGEDYNVSDVHSVSEEMERVSKAVESINLRVMQAVEQLRKTSQEQEIVEALRTISVILGNVLDHPNEKKYCQVRLANRGFHARCGRHEAAMEILTIAGFRKERDPSIEQEVLRLSRTDPGLLWLVRSCVEGAWHANIQEFTKSVVSKVAVPS